jgi:hypothetical protein
MPLDYLHKHPEFNGLLRTVERQKKIDFILVEKDYWLMHVLYGLQKDGFKFELKGGTSLSKGCGIFLKTLIFVSNLREAWLLKQARII